MATDARPPPAQVPVCAPPSTAADDDTAGPSTEVLYSLTIKCAKPHLSLELSASATATIGDLKASLARTYPDRAPAPDAQRWILKGKSMGDNKLLKEFNVQDGTVVNLMVTKSAAAAAGAASAGTAATTASPAEGSGPASAGKAGEAGDPGDMDAAAPPPTSPSRSTSPSKGGVPELTLSEPDPVTGHARRSSVSLLKHDLDHLPLSTSASNSEHPHGTGESDAFLAGVQSPDLWLDVRRVCEEKFSANQREAQKVWEAMFGGARDWISPNQKALIREEVGYSAMGGW